MKILSKTEEGIQTIYPQHVVVGDDEILMVGGDPKVIVVIPHRHSVPQVLANYLQRQLGVRVSRFKDASGAR